MSPTRESARSNPYDCAAPGRLFVGYEELLREVLRGLGDGKSYALLGGRRCGKTSILLRLQEELRRDEAMPFRVLPRFLDIQAVVPRSPFDFFSRLHALVSEGLEVPGWHDPPPRQTYQEFLSRLDELQPRMERTHGPRWLVVLLIDELDAALKYLPDDECFQNLRNLLAESRYKAYFRVMASGCSEMGRLIGAGSPLNNLHKQFTRILTVEEARELVTFGFPEGLDATVEAGLMRSTGRHAYVLQGLLEQLFDEPRPLSMEKVHRAGERFVRDHTSEFNVWHRDLGDAGRACYAALANVEPAALDRKELRKHVGAGISISDGLLTLSYHGLIHEDDTGHKHIACTLFRDWFLEDAPQVLPASMPTAPAQAPAPMNVEVPETLTPSLSPSPLSTTRDQVFISYSRKDKKWLERLQTHLKPRIRNGKVDVWSDDCIQAGDEWRKEIERALARARVAVLLVSPDFVASDFIEKNELHPLLEAARKDGVKILWVPVKTAAFREAKLDMYQGVLDPLRPLNKRHHAYVDEAMEEICNAIIKAFSGA